MAIVNSRLCDLVGIKYPIIQAGMGPFPTTELCIAAANAGCLGVMSTAAIGSKESKPDIFRSFCDAAGASYDDTPEDIIRKTYTKAFEMTKDSKGIFAANVMVSAEMKHVSEVAIGTMLKLREENPEMKERFKVLITSAGDPLPWSETIKKTDLVWMHVMPSVKAALRCKKAGVDVIIASGHEGGFHTSWEPVHSMILLPAVVETVSDDKTYVVGTGGYSDGRTMAAALVMGADGVQMGTRFLATVESDFAPLWKQAVVETGDRGTIVARGFVGPARWIKNARSVQHAKNTLKNSPGLFIGEPDDYDAPTTKELTAYEDESLIATANGDAEKGMMAAGESAQRINDMPKVKDMVEAVMKDCEFRLRDVQKYLG